MSSVQNYAFYQDRALINGEWTAADTTPHLLSTIPPAVMSSPALPAAAQQRPIEQLRLLTQHSPIGVYCQRKHVPACCVPGSIK